MSVIRISHQKNYVVISKIVLEDQDLSFKAKGLWAYCMSRPDNWEFHVSHLATVSKDKEDSVYSAIKELEKAGYVRKIQKNEKGKFGPVDYEISEIKIILPLRDFPDAGFPDAGNPALLNTDTKESNNKDCLLSGGADGQKISSIDKKKTKPLPSKESMKDLKVATNYFRDGTIIQTKLDDIIRDAVRLRKKWTTEEIMQAFEILCGYKGLIGDSFRFIEGTIENIQSKKKSENIAKRKGNTTCPKPEKKEYEGFKEKILEEDTKAQVLVNWHFTKIT